jgi:hypothetical protein
MLSDSDRDLYTARLAEARAALHALITGQQTVIVAYNGESVTFRSPDEGKLRRYIGELQAALDGNCRGPYRRGVIA